MRLLVLDRQDLRRALPMVDAVACMKDAFAALARGAAVVPPRTSFPVDAAGTSLLMGGYLPGEGVAAKLVSFFPGNREKGRSVVNGLVVVADAETGEPVGLVEGTALTALRTGAVSGAATDLLARPGARTGAVLGCGAQGRTQIEALDSVRELETIRVFDPRPGAAARLCEELAACLRARPVVATDSAAAVRGAEVVSCATSSSTPVFDGEDLAPGTHVNGVGSFTLEMQEVDATTVARARIVVDSLESALAEAGDLVLAERAGHTARADWIELGAIAAGRAPGRVDEDEITFFKSVGHAVQDVAAATRALRVARERGLGRVLEL